MAGAVVVDCLGHFDGETQIVPSLVAGEFYEGGACLGAERYREAIQFIERFTIAAISRETALRYAQTVVELRSQNRIGEVPKVDVWIAASALEHGATLITRNTKDFGPIQGLSVVEY